MSGLGGLALFFPKTLLPEYPDSPMVSKATIRALAQLKCAIGIGFFREGVFKRGCITQGSLFLPTTPQGSLSFPKVPYRYLPP